MKMSRRTLVTLTAATLPALSVASAAHSAPPTPPHADGAQALARARVAADVLMADYDQNKAWFPSSWWNSAVALQTVGDYMLRSGDRRYLDQLDHTFERNKGPFPAGELSGDELYGNFTSRAIDDSGWWALTWITAYDLTGDQKYLDMAVTIGDFMNDFWDPSTCGGGIWWDEERTYKNAVTNGQWIRLTAELHNRIPGDTAWLERSQVAWDWYTTSGMVNEDGLLNDGLTDACENNGDRVYTYNQGLAIGAALELWRATGDPHLLDKARYFADAALVEGALVTGGILTEYTDVLGETTNDNHKQFKGIFLRYLMDLADTTGDSRYRDAVATQASTIWEVDRNVADQLGVRWAGASTEESPNVFDWRTQASAFSALIADVPQDGVRRSLSASLSQAPVVMPDGEPVQLELDLDVTITSADARRLHVRLEAQGPEGWEIENAHRVTVDVPGTGRDGEPETVTVPLGVTVPADAADGDHRISVTASGPGGLEFLARTEVVVARTIDFAAGTREDAPWLFDAGGSGVTDEPGRFADGDSYFVYRFPFPASTTSAQLTLTISNQYLVDVGPDGESWTRVLAEDEPIKDASNRAAHELDLAPSLDGEDKDVYLRVTDAFPEDGWGGQVHHVSVTYGGS
ncbi:glycoside hydrolase family 76 protein [Brachybacterium sacelli]|uniref:Alpha-1,6-mannanase (GH76 family) n=1 Tax=Brachybacterium sacelli TaxID=173364 RepID=A0ABS4X6Z4_9MICO|nr:glycoside hydrolase family 76 protein [Brachybacterium sacelli]MBP2384223.1 putative alpha-1,6-mannanase (GH76 family) [Brachybacterium sacelli]